MINELRKRFIIFNMIVITCVLVTLALFVFWGSKSNPSLSRFIPVMEVCLVLVLAASCIISKFALRPIRHSWQQQLDFTADASHELRTPLAVIRTNLEIIMDNPYETVESQMKWLQNIDAEHTRMTKLVEDLLTLSRADTGEQNLFMSTFMLDETVKKEADIFLPICSQKQITLKQNIETGILFNGDEKRISQLIVILLDNAVQYTPSNGKITIEIHKKYETIELSVQDTGAGISKEDASKIFERFYRAENTRHKNPGGSGLGLSIAKWIANQHNGKIFVKSELGMGTTFSVLFHQ